MSNSRNAVMLKFRDAEEEFLYEDFIGEGYIANSSLKISKIPKIPKLVKMFPKKGSRLLVYRCKSGLRFIYKTHAKKNQLSRWRLSKFRSDTMEEVFFFWCHGHKDRDKVLHATYDMVWHKAEIETDENKIRSDGLDTLYTADIRQWRRDNRFQYPGDFLSDNVYWYNMGMIKASCTASHSCPHWSLVAT